jgi:hypothetical protein
MSVVGSSEIAISITGKVLTGGRRTKAVGVREIMNDMNDSYLNVVDGGQTVQAEAGYSAEIALTSNTSFAYKKWVEDAIAAGGGGSGDIRSDGSVPFAADQSMGGFSLLDVESITDPSNIIAANFNARTLRDTGTNIIANWSSRTNGFGITSTGPYAFLKTTALSASRTFEFPNVSGTLALTSDLGAYLPLAGGVSMTGNFNLFSDATTSLQPVTLQQMNAALVGLWDDRGTFDASVNLFPSTGGSGTASAILKGDIWTVSVIGTLGGVAVSLGDTVRALVDAPGQTAGNWAIGEANLGYTPLTNVLTSGYIFVGNGSNVATGVSPTLSGTSGSFSLSNSGVFTFPDADGSARGFLSAGTQTIGGAKTFNGLPLFTSDISFSSAKGIKDDNGNYVIVLPSTVASAVNYFTVSNSATGNAVSLEASGSDASVSINYIAKGASGVHNFRNPIYVYDDLGTPAYRLAFRNGTVTPNQLRIGDGFSQVVINNFTPTGDLAVSGFVMATSFRANGGNYYSAGGTGGGTGLGTHTFHITNGTAPAPSVTTDRHQYYSSDASAGNACPTWRTEDGSVIRLSANSGWTLPTGTATKGGWDTSTVTTQQLAETVKAMLDHLLTNVGVFKV